MISKYISLNEATVTRTGLSNIPNSNQLSAMKHVGILFDKVREHFGVAIGISSFFRSEKVNKAVGGASTSQHVNGEAIDIDADIYGRVTNKQIFDYIKANLTYDQLIWEHGTDLNPAWVHVSLKLSSNRKETLKAKKHGSKTIYTKYR